MKKIKSIGPKVRVIKSSSEPLRRIEPDVVAKELGAERVPGAAPLEGFSPALMDLRRQLLQKLR